MKMSGADALLKALEQEGVDTIFGIPVASHADLRRPVRQHDDPHILPRHEQGAVHAADGYARVTGKVGVCW